MAFCWTGQVFKHFPNPKPAYVADWDELPQWQQQTDADIFERIENEVCSWNITDHSNPPGAANVNFEEFDAWFDRFERSTFRLETLQRYSVSGEDERLRAFREGTPRPERSVRNDPWLHRIALTTAAGKRWQRVHVVQHPLTEYLRYELVSYVESAATGEDIRITVRATRPDLAALNEDFWLFDADTDGAYAVLMRYDEEGHFLGYDHTTDPDILDRCCAQRDLVLEHAVELNIYLASTKEVRQAG